MATADTSSILTVAQIRERWLPHRDRLDSIKESHPTSVRFHRACGWLEEAERMDAEAQGDHVLTFTIR
jgi:hypothetical protein